MALDKVVDSGALDSGLTGIADAIRAAGGTSADLTFPDGFTAAIGAMKTLAYVKTYTVPEAWTTDTKGNTTSIGNTVLAGMTRAANDLILLTVRNNASTSEYACLAIVYLGNGVGGAVARQSGVRANSATASAYITAGALIDVYKTTAFAL